jgi:hypothetical protein
MKRKSKYTVAYFMALFASTLKSQWTCGTLTNGERGRHKQCCALGFVGGEHESPCSRVLSNLFNDNLGVCVTDVNDFVKGTLGNFHSVPGKHPRTRVLNGLRRIQAKLERAARLDVATA